MRVCWYRALLERPPADGAHSAGQLSPPAAGCTGLQFSGCLTGASLIRSDDPLEQLRTCREPPRRRGADCLRGLRVQTYALAPFSTKLGLIRACANVRSAQRACYEWLGKTLNVITNGTFETTRLRAAPLRGLTGLVRPRRALVRGARSRPSLVNHRRVPSISHHNPM